MDDDPIRVQPVVDPARSAASSRRPGGRHQECAAHALPPSDEVAEDVAGRVRAWRPAGVDDTVALAAAREAVLAAGPRSWFEARNATNYAAAYLAWRRTVGLPVAGPDVFGEEAVKAYRKAALSGRHTGSADAIVSTLRRIHPDVGLAGTTRPSAQGKEQPTSVEPPAPSDACAPDGSGPAPVAGPASPAELPAPVEAEIASYWPQLVDRALLTGADGAIRDVVRAACPRTRLAARDLLRAALYAAAWVASAQLPARPDVVFDPERIERFCTTLDRGGVPATSVANYSYWLHLMRGAAGIPVGDVRIKVWDAAVATHAPYSDADETAILTAIGRASTTSRRRHLTAGWALCRWAGAAGADANWVSVDHITVTNPDDVTVRFTRTVEDPLQGSEGHTLAALGLHRPGGRQLERTVRLTGRAAREVAAVRQAAVDAGEHWLLGGGDGQGVRRQRISAIFRPPDPKWKINFLPARARYRWIVERAAAGADLLDLIDSAGYIGCDVLSHLLPYIRAARAEADDAGRQR
jgi:hypothetical protein